MRLESGFKHRSFRISLRASAVLALVFLTLSGVRAETIELKKTRPGEEQKEQKESSQAMRRTERNIHIGGLVLGGVSLLRLGYNLNDSFSLSFKGLTATESKLTEFRDLFLTDTRVRLAGPLGFLSAAYYPFKKFPLYFSADIIKTSGSNVRIHELSRINPTLNFSNPTNIFDSRPITYTLTASPTTGMAGGIGFNWIFSSGLSLGLEFLRTYAPTNLNIFLDNDWRGFNPDIQALTPLEVFLETKYLEYRFPLSPYGSLTYFYLAYNF